MTLEFIKCATLEKVYASCFFFSLWRLICSDSFGLSRTAYRSRSVRGYPRLPTFEGHARTRMPMHDGDMHLRRREIATFPRGAVVKGRTCVVIRGVARRDYDVSKVSVGPIKANSSNHRCAVRAPSIWIARDTAVRDWSQKGFWFVMFILFPDDF